MLLQFKYIPMTIQPVAVLALAVAALIDLDHQHKAVVAVMATLLAPCAQAMIAVTTCLLTA